MATTEYGVNHPLARKAWAKELWHEALKETYVSRFMGSDTDSLIVVKGDLAKDKGDRITQGLRMIPTGAGVSGDNTQEGNEEQLTTANDNILIDQLRHAHRSAGRMSEQRVTFDMRAECKMALRDWWSDRLDTWFFNQIAGNTGQSDLRYVGHNATTAPTNTSGNTRHLFADGASTTEGSLSASQFFQLSYIDRAVTTAKVSTPLIRPLRVNGSPKFVMFLHPFQVNALRTDAATTRITWYDATRALAEGGQGTKNGIYSGALGEYNGVILHESTRIPSVVANTRRAVLCGAQAAMFAYGQANSPTRMFWNEETFDYGNQFGVAAGLIAGMKKTVFAPSGTSVDFGTIVVSSYAVAP